MTDPSDSNQPKRRLIIPGAPAPEPEPVIEEPVAEEFIETEEPVEEYYEEEAAEYVADEVEGETTDEFMMVDSAEGEEEYQEGAETEEHLAEADEESPSGLAPILTGSTGPTEPELPEEAAAPPQNHHTPAEIEPVQTSVKRLRPRGEEEGAAPTNRAFSPYTSAVSLETAEEEKRAVKAATSTVPRATAAQQLQATRQGIQAAKHQASLPGWVFSMIGFLVGVAGILLLVKVNLMPSALGLTDSKNVREAAAVERARIIKILKDDDYDPEDWDNFRPDSE